MLAKRLILSVTLACAINGMAQDSLLLRDFHFVKQQDPWLLSKNAAAMTRFSEANISAAEVSLSHQQGGLTDFNGATKLTQSKAGIESFFRLSRRTVFYGSLSFTKRAGENMGGSAFIPTGTLRPFDIVEDSLGNEGEKDLDVYRLSGGFGATVWKDIALGARLDYTAANYAKYKDLRHQNRFLDLLASASIYVPLGRLLSMGAHYQYHRNIENVAFSTYGKSDKTYKSLVDYGGFFGKAEQFGEQGYTDKSREMPLVDEGHGGGLQIELRPLPALSLYGGLTLAHSSGYYGRKSPFTITYTQHTTDQQALTARITYEPDRSSSSSRLSKSKHSLDFSFVHESLKNNANTYRELKNPSGATYYEYYDPVETGNKKRMTGSIAYTCDWQISGNVPTWTVRLGMYWMERKQTGYVYPYYRYQKLSNQEYFLGLTRNLIRKSGIWSFSLNASFKNGAGNPYADGILQTPSTTQAALPTMEAYLMREYQYLTAAQYAVGGQLKYTFVFPGTRLKTHARLALTHRKANEQFNFSNGCDRTEGLLAVGCTF